MSRWWACSTTHPRRWRRSSPASATVRHGTLPDSSTHCISSGFNRSANSLSAASSSSASTPDTSSMVEGSISMYSSSTPTVTAGPAPNLWSRTLARAALLPDACVGMCGFYSILTAICREGAESDGAAAIPGPRR